jgi:predicted HTH transcriptional regulator
MKKIKVFISSSQRELRTERIAVQEVILETEILNRYFEIEMWEEFPAMGISPRKAYLEKLKECEIYIGIFGKEYSEPTVDEYHAAKEYGKYILIFLKGKNDMERDDGLRELLKEFRGHKGYAYKRFEDDYRELKRLVFRGLIYFLEKEKNIKISVRDKNLLELIKTSYDMNPVLHAACEDISLKAVISFLNISGAELKNMASNKLYSAIYKKGFLCKIHGKTLVPSASGLLLFGKNPEDFLVQSKIKADCFQGNEPVNTIDQEDIKGTIPEMIKKSESFFLRNMKTAMRIEGFSRVQIDEYPLEALREAVVNAVVHRDYEIKGATVLINMFSNRVEIASPGLLPQPLTIDMIRSLHYRPVSRNPIIARTMYEMGLMEERGGGIRRMHDLMINHGLKPPEFGYDSGYFIVTFNSPMEKILELHPKKVRVVYSIEESKRIHLNKRQESILQYLLEHARITSMDCTELFNVTRDTTNRDFKKLIENNLIEQKGTGRGTYYVLK